MKKRKGEEGKVYLIGAGPGDPKLLTLRGRECIGEAEVVIYDFLANERLLDYAPPGAEIICAGKRKGGQSVSQERINEWMIERARRGKVVARLKGGDPFVFGRGGEEAMALATAGIPFEVIPGVSSASGVPAYAGIPLTHRDYSALVVLTTGHEDPSKAQSNIPWENIAPGTGTLVFFMGVTNLDGVVSNLMKHGRDPDTPVAVICRGTRPEQQTVTGVLSDIADRVSRRRLPLPGMVVVGDVVRLREQLNWFERRPLFGRRILVTRPEEQVSDFAEALARYGAEPELFSTVRVVPPEDWGPLDRAVARLPSYQWVIFTSVNGVKYFAQRLHASGRDARALGAARVCAIGPRTAQALEGLGISADLVPEKFQAEGVLEAMKQAGVGGQRILLPRAQQAREVLPEDLRRMGAEVDVVPAYRSVRPEADLERVKGLLSEGKIAAVTFTSSSTVRNFVELMGPGDLKGLLDGVKVASIGPITARTVEEAGLVNDIMPDEYTIAALAGAIADYFKQQP